MHTHEKLTIVVLAAGKGTRMKSAKAKVLHEVLFQPMIHHVLAAAAPLEAGRTVVIVGHQEDSVRAVLKGRDVVTVRQQEQLGTGHAVLMTESSIPEDDGQVMVLCGDTPLVRTESLLEMVKQHNSTGAMVTVMTTVLDNPFGYGRIVADNGRIRQIVEEKEATEEQKGIKEINAGIYLVQRQHLFAALKTLTPDNSQGEFYLTDIVEYSANMGIDVHTYTNYAPQEVLGVNSRIELEQAHLALQQRRNRELMLAGVAIENSVTTCVSPFSMIGTDTLLQPHVQINGSTSIGRGCIIESGAVITDCTVGDNVRIGANSVLRQVTVESGSTVAPLSLVTEGS